MRKTKLKSALPVYAAAASWLIMVAAGMKLYKLHNILIAVGVSLLVYVVTSLIAPKKNAVYVEPPPEPEKSGDATADAVLQDGREAISKLQGFAASIKNHNVRGQAALLEGLLEDILDYILKHPGKAGQIRRFANYYLPTTIKLFTSYEHLEQQDGGGSNINSTMDSIQSALSNIVKAYRNQLDSLFADTRLDISTDIEVLEGMMRSDGLLDDEHTI